MKRTTFESYIEQFLRYIKLVRNLSPHTQRAYTADLQQLIVFWQEQDDRSEKKLALREAVDHYCISLFQKSVDKSSIARKISCLRSFAKFLKTELDVTIHLKLARPRLDKKLPSYLSEDEVRTLLDKTPLEQLESPYPYRDRAILELFYATGIRCAELVAIRMLHINFPDQSLIIRGKGRRERIVLFGATCKERLLEYLQKERAPSKHQTEHLFVNYRNQPLTTRSVQRICASFQKFLGSQRPLTPHKLRHSFATHLINQGASLCTVQRLLGHASLTSTEKYTHISLERLQKLCAEKHPLLSSSPDSQDV